MTSVVGICAVTLAALTFLSIDPVTAYAGLTGIGIYFLLPLLIITAASVPFMFRNMSMTGTRNWSRIVAPSLSFLVLLFLFICISLNLDLLVGDRAMSVLSIVLVIAVPAAGWALAAFYESRRPEIYDKIGSRQV